MKLRKMLSAAAAIMAAVMMLSACGRGGDTSSAPQGAGGEGVSAEASQNTEENTAPENSDTSDLTSQPNKSSQPDTENESSENSAETEHSDKSSESKNSEEALPSDTESSETDDLDSLNFEEKIEQMFDTEGKTEAQISAMQKLSDKCNYERAVVTGVIDPDAPKLTVEDVKKILEEAERLYPYSPPKDNLSDDEIEAFAGKTTSERQDYVMQKINKIQMFPDHIGVYGAYYFPEYVCTDKESFTFYKGKIHDMINIVTSPLEIYYEKYDDEGNKLSTDALIIAQYSLSEFLKNQKSNSHN